jgi:hypothetical protein
MHVPHRPAGPRAFWSASVPGRAVPAGPSVGGPTTTGPSAGTTEGASGSGAGAAFWRAGATAAGYVPTSAWAGGWEFFFRVVRVGCAHVRAASRYGTLLLT